MASIYIHIPFCKTKCFYCDFYSTVKLSYLTDFTDSLLKEIAIRQKYLSKQTISTIYFGGGTPSLLQPYELQKIIIKIKDVFDIKKDIEITMEANPEDLTEKYIAALKNTEINRISVGIQSFEDNILQTLNRRHTAQQAISAIELLQKHGFLNISADLIYGIPGLSLQTWEKNLYRFIQLKIPHLSAYHLTYEPHSVFGYYLKKNKITPLKEKQSAEQYDLLCYIARKNKLFHYEISNFGIQGFISEHNNNYWNNTNYLGFGPGAHSFNNIARQWNKPNLFRYISNLKAHKLPPHQQEILSDTDKFNDYIITRLRTINGIKINEIRRQFPQFYHHTKKVIDLLKTDTLNCKFEKGKFSLTEKGFFLSDTYMEKFIILAP
ncbi:MAG TPA: radical SAM family heme chaperone HemW [Bacteroidales bacterium]|nr:radical SAM family heme chaperone HemW [Bacteroidales bacterium]